MNKKVHELVSVTFLWHLCVTRRCKPHFNFIRKGYGWCSTRHVKSAAQTVSKALGCGKIKGAHGKVGHTSKKKALELTESEPENEWKQVCEYGRWWLWQRRVTCHTIPTRILRTPLRALGPPHPHVVWARAHPLKSPTQLVPIPQVDK